MQAGGHRFDPGTLHLLYGGGFQASGDPAVKSLGCDVRAIRPHNRSQFLVELDAPEIRWIRQRFEDSAPLPARKIDLSVGAVLEGQAKTVVADDFDSCHVHELGHCLILGKRRNTFERLAIASASPVLLEIAPVELCPLANKPQRAVR